MIFSATEGGFPMYKSARGYRRHSQFYRDTSWIVSRSRAIIIKHQFSVQIKVFYAKINVMCQSLIKWSALMVCYNVKICGENCVNKFKKYIFGQLTKIVIFVYFLFASAM